MPNSNKICIACGKLIRSNAIFCSHCGLKITEQTSCSECGEVLFANEKFCRHCGTEVIEKPKTNE